MIVVEGTIRGKQRPRFNTKSTILEIGFLNNERDRNYLINQQDRYAECIAKGIYEQLTREG